MATKGNSIAIVDDDAPVLKALGRLLRGRGFKTKTFESASAFLTALTLERPDCLILDLQMPGMNGLELLWLLKRRGINIPTIVITGNGSEETAGRCAAAGAAAFLHKPLQNPTLFAAIDQVTTAYSNGRRQ